MSEKTKETTGVSEKKERPAKPENFLAVFMVYRDMEKEMKEASELKCNFERAYFTLRYSQAEAILRKSPCFIENNRERDLGVLKKVCIKKGYAFARKMCYLNNLYSSIKGYPFLARKYNNLDLMDIKELYDIYNYALMDLINDITQFS